ncbi:MAG: hypothetical protein HY719_14205 [Planctomycetes bacterium]|nr:hypothetical protein [Planctomycetota bacterium]
MANLLKKRRSTIERRIGLFDQPLHARRARALPRRQALHRTPLCQGKALFHNASRHVSAAQSLPVDSMPHFSLAAAA